MSNEVYTCKNKECALVHWSHERIDSGTGGVCPGCKSYQCYIGDVSNRKHPYHDGYVRYKYSDKVSQAHQQLINNRIYEISIGNVGKQLDFTSESHGNIVGECHDVRLSFSRITNVNDTSQQEYGVEFKIKPNNGKRAFWTKPFPTGIATPGRNPLDKKEGGQQ